MFLNKLKLAISWRTSLQQYLEVPVEVRPELPLQPVAVEPEEALEPVSVARGGVLPGQRPELRVHLLIEVLPQEERPEAEEGVDLLAVPDTQLLPLLQAPRRGGVRRCSCDLCYTWSGTWCTVVA